MSTQKTYCIPYQTSFANLGLDLVCVRLSVMEVFGSPSARRCRKEKLVKSLSFILGRSEDFIFVIDTIMIRVVFSLRTEISPEAFGVFLRTECFPCISFQSVFDARRRARYFSWCAALFYLFAYRLALSLFFGKWVTSASIQGGVVGYLALIFGTQ